jgi:hypothetical protein
MDRPSVRRRLLLHLGKKLFEEEPHVVIAEAVVFEAAIETVERLSGKGLHPPMHHEDADDDRHLLLMDEIIEDGRGVVLEPVLVDVHARRLGRIVLLGHVDPVVAYRAGENLALMERILGDLSLRHRGVLRTQGRRRQTDESQQGKASALGIRHGLDPLRSRRSLFGHTTAVIVADAWGVRQGGRRSRPGPETVAVSRVASRCFGAHFPPRLSWGALRCCRISRLSGDRETLGVVGAVRSFVSHNARWVSHDGSARAQRHDSDGLLTDGTSIEIVPMSQNVPWTFVRTGG